MKLSKSPKEKNPKTSKPRKSRPRYTEINPLKRKIWTGKKQHTHTNTWKLWEGNTLPIWVKQLNDSYHSDTKKSERSLGRKELLTQNSSSSKNILQEWRGNQDVARWRKISRTVCYHAGLRIAKGSSSKRRGRLQRKLGIPRRKE